MARRRIGQERLAVGNGEVGKGSSLDEVAALIDWAELDALLAGISAAAKGEPGWPPLALFRALLLATWHDLSDVRLAGALDDRCRVHAVPEAPGSRRPPGWISLRRRAADADHRPHINGQSGIASA